MSRRSTPLHLQRSSSRRTGKHSALVLMWEQMMLEPSSLHDEIDLCHGFKKHLDFLALIGLLFESYVGHSVAPEEVVRDNIAR